MCFTIDFGLRAGRFGAAAIALQLAEVLVGTVVDTLQVGLVAGDEVSDLDSSARLWMANARWAAAPSTGPGSGVHEFISASKRAISPQPGNAPASDRHFFDEGLLNGARGGIGGEVFKAKASNSAGSSQARTTE